MIAALPACHADPGYIAGHMPDLRFSLFDEHNRAVTAADYRGAPVVLYFGYTGCGGQCPLILKRLENISNNVRFRVLFVSVDPLDSPTGLRAYVSLYPGLQVSGLSGPAGNVKALARRYRAAYSLPAHGTALYIFDARGRIRFLLTEQATDQRLLVALRDASHE
jgi:protein SCO1/2